MLALMVVAGVGLKGVCVWWSLDRRVNYGL